MLPEGWREVRLQKVLRQVDRRAPVESTRSYRLLGVRWYGNGCHLHDEIPGRTLKTAVLNEIRANDITYNKMWVTKGAFAVATEEHDSFWATSEYPTFEANQQEVLPSFLRLVMKTPAFVAKASAKTLGTTSRARLSATDFLDLEIELPPLAEQRRIAEILQAADDAVATAEAVIEQTEKVKRGLVEELLTRGMPGRHSRFKMTEIGELPESWEVVELSVAADVCNGPRTPIAAEERSKIKGSYPYYGPTKVLDHLSVFSFEGDYVLIGEDGDHFLKFDRWNMTQRVSGKFSVNNHAHVLQGTRAQNQWLDWYFRHRNITALTTRQGANRYKLRKATLLQLPLALPTLDEQSEICTVLDAADLRVNEARHHVGAVRRLRDALCSELVSGRVRVRA